MNLRFAFLLMFSLIACCIELEISAPSFPDIMNSLQISEQLVGLTITYNLIAFCIAALIYGPLSEIFGRRRIMIIGNAILAIGALGCAMAPSIQWLLASRFIQGFGAATSAVVVLAMIADVYSTDKAAKLYGFMNAFFTTLMSLAPVTGGFISAAIGWRGNYTVVAVICVISWLVLYKFLPETHQKILGKNSTINDNNFSSVGGVQLLTTTLVDYKRLLTSPLFLITSSIPSLLYGAYVAFVAIAPFIYMSTFKLSILEYTLHQGSILAVFALVSIFSGKITSRLGMYKTIWISLGFISLASILMLISNTAYEFTLSNIISCFGSALLYPVIFAKSFEIFPELRGTASSAMMSLRYLSCAGITALASYLYDGKPFTLAAIILVANSIVVALTYVLLKKMQWVQADPIIDTSIVEPEL